jgi:hypothetical protein
LNPGPHDPESHALPSSHDDSCGLWFEISEPDAQSVQIWTNLQLDYYMKYYIDRTESAAPPAGEHRFAIQGLRVSVRVRVNPEPVT